MVLIKRLISTELYPPKKFTPLTCSSFIVIRLERVSSNNSVLYCGYHLRAKNLQYAEFSLSKTFTTLAFIILRPLPCV
jgi:hypothetical protein